MKKLKYLTGTLFLVTASGLLAEETVSYTYDARGRLTKVERKGTVNDGAKVEYQLDKADNRKKVKATRSAQN